MGDEWPQVVRGKIAEATRPEEDARTIPQVHVSPFMKEAWPEVVKCGLLRRAPDRGRCGLFEVVKTNALYRVIFDARPANATLTRMAGPLSLFRVEELCSLAARWVAWSRRTGRSIRAATIDFRHFFYQVRLREQLTRYFAVVLGETVLIPEVMHMAGRAEDRPVVALYREDGGSLAADKEELPTIITADGFHIFVLLDGIFIIGVTEEVEREMAQMDRNIQRFGIVPKASEDATGVRARANGGDHVFERGHVTRWLSSGGSGFPGPMFDGCRVAIPSRFVVVGYAGEAGRCRNGDSPPT